MVYIYLEGKIQSISSESIGDNILFDFVEILSGIAQDKFLLPFLINFLNLVHLKFYKFRREFFLVILIKITVFYNLINNIIQNYTG